jgi:hypothetical protein
MSRLKECFKCKAVKPLVEFYKHSMMADGHLNKCKECTKNDANKHRAENLEKIRAYDRERGKKESRIKHTVEVTRAWRQQNKLRSAAHSAVARAMKKGDLVRQPCEVCNHEKTVAHHDDYDKPLSVRWLCQPCHMQHHHQIRKLME